MCLWLMSASDFHKYIMIKEYNSADVAILYTHTHTYTNNLFTYILKDLVDYTKSRVFLVFSPVF